MSDTKNTQLHVVTPKPHRRRFLATALAATAASLLHARNCFSPRIVAPEPGSHAELVQKALDRLLQSELAEFASHLETARTLIRRYPELVEARKSPEHLRVAFVAVYGTEPSDDCDILSGEPFITDEVRERVRPFAEEIARGWAASGHDPRSAS